MAKGKHSAALFEVINSAKKPGLLGTPKWWFKGRPAPTVAQPPVSEAAPAEPHIAAPVMPTSSYGSRPSGSMAARGLRVDRDRNEVHMRLRFSTAVVGGFALLVVVGMAYVVGQRVSGGPKSAVASDLSTEQLRQEPATPKTLDVPRRQPKQTVTNKETLVSSSNSNPAKRVDPPARSRETVTSSANGKIFTPEPQSVPVGPRDFGKNYILVQSFAPEQMKLAEQAVDVLGKAGVPCSIEKAPKGIAYNPDGRWVAVITRVGFEGKSQPACKECLHTITDVQASLNREGHSSKLKFEPQIFKWQ